MIDAGIGANSASGGYDIDNSVKLEADNSEYFNRTPSSNTNRQNFTFSTWVKRTELGQNSRLLHVHQDGQNFFTLGFDTSDRLVLYDIISSVDYGGHYSQRFRDTSAWYHIVFRSETTSGTATTRWKIYVNGVEITAKDTDYGTPPRWYQSNVNRTIDHRVGYNTDGSNGSSQYMAETHFVDGSNLNPTSFGEFDEDSGIWKPIEYTGSYGTNGFYLDYADGSDLGNDANGSNNFAENNLTAADQAVDTPTNNFATWQLNNYNPTSSANFTFIEGATTPKRNSGDAHVYCVSTMAMSSGKWYMEYKVRSSSDSVYFGGTPITQFASENHNGYYLGQDGGGSIGYGAGAFLYYWTGANTQYTENRATGDIIGVALDKDNDKIAFSKNGTFMLGTNGVRTDPSTPSTMHEVQAPPYFWAFGAFTGSIQYETNMGGYTSMSISSAASDANGYGTFEYAPPTGYYALCTKNLAEYG